MCYCGIVLCAIVVLCFVLFWYCAMCYCDIGLCATYCGLVLCAIVVCWEFDIDSRSRCQCACATISWSTVGRSRSRRVLWKTRCDNNLSLSRFVTFCKILSLCLTFCVTFGHFVSYWETCSDNNLPLSHFVTLFHFVWNLFTSFKFGNFLSHYVTSFTLCES